MRRLLSAFLIFLLATGVSSPILADLVVERGATKIKRGEALGRKDITVDNGVFAVAFAVQTAPPWGVARGGIIDIAFHYEDGLGYDIASLADFMPNNWSAWPTTRQRVKVDKKSRDEVVVRTERDWGEVELVTTFTIRDMDPVIHVVTTMSNEGDDDLDDILSGYVVWPDGGFLFGVPGLSGETSADEATALADWSASYDHNWVLGTHAPFATLVSYGGRDRYASHTLPAGGTATFETWFELRPEGSLSHLVAD